MTFCRILWIKSERETQSQCTPGITGEGNAIGPPACAVVVGSGSTEIFDDGVDVAKPVSCHIFFGVFHSSRRLKVCNAPSRGGVDCS